MARLRQAVEDFRSAAETAQVRPGAEAHERLSVEERARRDREKRTIWEQLASEAEQAKLPLAAELSVLQAAAAAQPHLMATLIAKAEEAAAAIDIDEAVTRTLIDVHLRARGWEVDTPTFRYICPSF